MRNYSAVSEVFGNHAKDTFSTIRITVASPDKIRSWSRGEVKNPETLNYRTFKPEKGGLFCEKIFGPTRDWECSCGKYRRFKHKGIVCDRCGVEVTHSRVRRERMGHIELAVPMSHVWFFKCMPSKLGLMMDMKSKDLERAIYYDSWMIIDPGDTPYSEKQLLTDEEYNEAREAYGDAFKAAMGAEGVKEVLKKIDLPAFREELSAKMAQTKSKTERKKITKRLRIVEGFCSANMRPEWMILDVLPVLPPDLRPLVPLEGGRFATSDLNDLYRRVINRNNRLKNLLTLKTPEVIIRNEKRMLQEAIDALMDNGRQGRPVTGSNNRQLKSLSDTLKGKQGRFRQNLLGKRVDYSGRSVIVVGPELKLNQCGLPKKMALTLFEPFIVHKLKKSGMAHTVRSAKKLIEEEDPKVWDILEEVIKGHPVLLNRAPTLHRLSIQAFDPVLIEGQAIRVHPMVCSAYNADFDGDQMAVHIPLSNEAQLETKLLMLATNNVFYPSSGKPICSPSQDITLGSYYLTYMKPGAVKRTKHPKAFSDAFEVIRLWDMGLIPIHQVIRLMNPNRGKDTFWGDKESKFIITTPGRCIFNDIWPEEMGFFNQVANKSSLGDLVSSAYSILGNEKTVTILDKLKETGYIYATKSGFSIGITDMIIPSEKAEIVAEGQKATEEVRNQYYNKGIITEGERYNRFIDIWTNAKNQIASVLLHTLERNNGSDEINSIYAMLDSGARGSNDQVRQLSGMRGLMAKPSGEIIQRPILSSFREGLSVLEFFISSHGARKGLADTALKTADSGYMTRKLVDVAHDLICTEEDCQTTQGIWVSPIREGDEEMLSLQERIVGRTSVDDIRDPLSQKDESIVQSGEEITLEIAGKIVAVGLDRVLIRSSLTCHSEGGICAKCYGRNLAIDGPIKKGDSIGIIAAQSIGEPGTQLTMRTFHYGGTASSSFKQPFIKARHDGVIKLIDARIVKTPEGSIILNKNAEIAICDEKGFEQERYQLMPGAILHKEEGESLEEEETFVHWDPYNIPVITEYGGKIKFVDLIEGITMKEEINETTGNREITVLEHREDLFPQILIIDDNDDLLAHYSIPAGAHIMVESGVKVNPGKILARRPRQVARTKDITGGLPRVAELFEARRPKNPAEIAKIDGIVELGTLSKGKRSLLVRDESGGIEEHLIPASKHIVVFDGESVKKGDPLTDGSVVPHEILDICGPQDLQRYLVNEIQTVYRLQGVEINDKHIEVIVRQMLRKIRVSETGDTKFLYGEQVDKTQFLEENNRIISEGGRAAEGQPVLLGITKASLETESFISAASFQDTTRILTDAATLGKVDILKGFKENVIVGHLIPAGTGYHLFQDIKIKEVGRPVSMTKKGILEDSDDEKSDDKYVSSMTTQEATQLL